MKAEGGGREAELWEVKLNQTEMHSDTAGDVLIIPR